MNSEKSLKQIEENLHKKQDELNTLKKRNEELISLKKESKPILTSNAPDVHDLKDK